MVSEHDQNILYAWHSQRTNNNILLKIEIKFKTKKIPQVLLFIYQLLDQFCFAHTENMLLGTKMESIYLPGRTIFSLVEKLFLITWLLLSLLSILSGSGVANHFCPVLLECPQRPIVKGKIPRVMQWETEMLRGGDFGKSPGDHGTCPYRHSTVLCPSPLLISWPWSQ